AAKLVRCAGRAGAAVAGAAGAGFAGPALGAAAAAVVLVHRRVDAAAVRGAASEAALARRAAGARALAARARLAVLAGDAAAAAVGRLLQRIDAVVGATLLVGAAAFGAAAQVGDGHLHAGVGAERDGDRHRVADVVVGRVGAGGHRQRRRRLIGGRQEREG